MDKIIALLPIREHSERVKDKNFKNLCGKPLYRWVLETLLKCKRIDRVVVDTDGEIFIREMCIRDRCCNPFIFQGRLADRSCR